MMLSRTEVPTTVESDLFSRLSSVLSVGQVVSTLGPSGRPNVIHDVTPEAIWVSTERSNGVAQPVPGWMFNIAWAELTRAGRLSSADLVTKAKRSSAVLALLAQLPAVEVESSRPLVVRLCR